jgi:hypothetical protein
MGGLTAGDARPNAAAIWRARCGLGLWTCQLSIFFLFANFFSCSPILREFWTPCIFFQLSSSTCNYWLLQLSVNKLFQFSMVEIVTYKIFQGQLKLGSWDLELPCMHSGCNFKVIFWNSRWLLRGKNCWDWLREGFRIFWSLFDNLIPIKISPDCTVGVCWLLYISLQFNLIWFCWYIGYGYYLFYRFLGQSCCCTISSL